MVSTEILRNYPFFSRLSEEQLVTLVSCARFDTIEGGQFVCRIGEKLDYFFLIVEGELDVLIKFLHFKVEYETTGQPTQLEIQNIKIGQITAGDICGWSALVPPYIATSSIRTSTICKIISFDTTALLKLFNEDCNLGFYMIQTAAQVIGKRLQDIYHLQDSKWKESK